MADVVFGVGTGVQFENIKPLFPFLTEKGVSFELLELATMKLEKIGIAIEARRPSLSAIAKALIFSFPKETKILYLQQDVGIIEKIVIAKAKKQLITTCINPDGLIWEMRKIPKEMSIRNGTIESLKLFLQAFRLIGNRDSNWFKSEPDYIFSWGEAWGPIYEINSPNSSILITGCPRFEQHLSRGESEASENTLIASTPVELLGLSETEIKSYYDLLLNLCVAQDPTKIRVRLHPHELISDKVPRDLKNQNSDKQLSDDLDWADIAISPISTVLLEAAIRNLSIGFIGEGSTLAALRQGNIFFRHLVDLLGTSFEVNGPQFKTKKLDSGIQNYCRMSPLPSHVITDKIYEITRGSP
jgi:hypothetical protein